MEVNVFGMSIPECENYACNKKCYMKHVLTDSCCSLYQSLINRVAHNSSVLVYTLCTGQVVHDVLKHHAAFIIRVKHLQSNSNLHGFCALLYFWR
jgi:hypothetical protein